HRFRACRPSCGAPGSSRKKWRSKRCCPSPHPGGSSCSCLRESWTAPNPEPGKCGGAEQYACRRCPSSSRSEEHTSELQSRENLVCRLLLEKKKNKHIT